MAKQIVFDLGPKTKVCGDCKQIKPLLEFYKKPNGHPRSACRTCHSAATRRWNEENREYRLAYVKEWNAKNFEKRREYNRKERENRTPEKISRDRDYNFSWKLKRKYGLSLKEWKDLLSSQEGVCALCRKRENSNSYKLNVDHCHETGRVRGLLCSPCNRALGVLGDTPEKIEHVLGYVRDGHGKVDMIPRKMGSAR